MTVEELRVIFAEEAQGLTDVQILELDARAQVIAEVILHGLRMQPSAAHTKRAACSEHAALHHEGGPGGRHP